MVCAFTRPDGTFVTETDLRKAVTAAATAERAIWWPGSSIQKEEKKERFGDLVRYWLAGRTATVRPGKLEAVQKAAQDPIIAYTNFSNATLNTAIQNKSAAEAQVDAATSAVYRKWDDVDAATAKVAPAVAKVQQAATEVKAAEDRVKAAVAAVRAANTQTRNAAQAALGQERAALSTAKTTLKDAEKDRDNARKAVVAAKAAVTAAENTYDRKKAASKALNAAAENWKLAEKRKIRQAVLSLAASPDKQDIDGVIDEDLQHAQNSRADTEPWSAVFVVACIRAAAISLKLDAIDSADKHRGKNGLIKASSAHSRYIIEARDRKKNGVNAAYHAFEPTAQKVQIGDIICTDRKDFIDKPQSLSTLVEGPILHGDIVTRVKIGNPGFAETIGGNVNQTVRRRCYPLDAQGLLIVSNAQLYAQEDDNGKFVWPPGVLSPVPTRIQPKSTGRILALLSLVCAPVADPAAAWKGTGSGKTEKLVADALESLETPFVDRGLLQPEPERVFGSNFDRLAMESPFEKLTADKLFPSMRTYEREADDEFHDASNANDAVETVHEDADDHSHGWDEEASPEYEEYAEEADVEEEFKDLAPADTIDELAAQTPFSRAVRDRVEPLPDAKTVKDASAWNKKRHPGTSGIDASAIRTRFDRYLNSAAVEQAMRDNPGLTDLSADSDAVLAALAHQFQQKVYAPAAANPDGRIGEGTLDALGFVRHRGDSLNAVDATNVNFHVKGNSKAFKRIKEVFNGDRNVFADLGSDVAPKTWFCLFVNAPFLGRPIGKGISVELMRHLRQAEKWLLGVPAYRNMSSVELGIVLGIDEDHHGGRSTNNSSMHTLGLALDIGYVKNPWVAGQHDNTGQPSTNRNNAFQAVTRNVSRLISGSDDVLTPKWLSSFGSTTGQTTEQAYDEIRLRHTNMQTYLALENDAGGLRATIEARQAGPHPELVIKPSEPIDAAVKRWRGIIKGDRAKLQMALGSRKPRDGFLNLHRDLVIALRDHACLAWGAMDLGGSSSGDMMHFDCRATGIGWNLALEKQRTAGAGHPCFSRTQVSQELETPRVPPTTMTPAAGGDFLGGKVWTFTATTLAIRVAIFCPSGVTSPKDIDVLLYAHGLLGPCPPVPSGPADFITKRPFELGKIVDASKRDIVLVVPFLEWEKLEQKKLSYEACNRKTMHLLGTPANLNGVMAEVQNEIGRAYGLTAPRVRNLILAGHSRAYDFLNPLAMAHVDPEMSRGALGVLSQVWCLHTTYVCFMAEWMRWLNSKSGLQIKVFYRKGSYTDACGQRFEEQVAKAGGRLTVTRAKELHCQVPARRLPGLLTSP